MDLWAKVSVSHLREQGGTCKPVISDVGCWACISYLKHICSRLQLPASFTPLRERYAQLAAPVFSGKEREHKD